MTRQEFVNRTLVNVSEKEYAAIETVYMASDLEKDEFCKMWRKMNASRVREAKAEKMEKARKEAYRDALLNMVKKFRFWSKKHSAIDSIEALTINMTTSYEEIALKEIGIKTDVKMYMTCYSVCKHFGIFI